MVTVMAINGTSVNDTVVGTTQADLIYGMAGNDTVTSGDGNDTVYGGDGNDSLSGQAGNDMHYGGFTGGSTTAIGVNFITNGSFSAGATGWSGNDIEANNTENVYQRNGATNGVAEADGNGGQTTVMQQSFAVVGTQSANVSFRSVMRNDAKGVIGTNGFRADMVDSTGRVIGTMTVLPSSKTAWASYSFSVTFPAAGTYTLRITEIGNNDSYGALIDDMAVTTTTVAVDAAADTISGGDGDDSIFGEIGNDSLSGDAGNDSVSGATGADTLYGRDGADTLSGDGGNDALYGDGGTDLLSGGDNDDRLDGGIGDDTLRGDGGKDTLDGGDGNDHLFGGDAEDSLRGGAGDDSLSGDASQDRLFGGAGSDTLSGGAGDDQLDGGDGADQLDGGTGQDNLSGGAGDDNLAGGTGDDRLYGGTGADVLDGGDNNDWSEGGAGNDTLIGGAGADQIYGGDDADMFIGPFGVGDQIDGGEGGIDRDTLDLRGAGPFRIDRDPNDPTNLENGIVRFLAPVTGHAVGSLSFKNIETVIPCFTPGTLIATAHGPVPVETLQEGDSVLTRDDGEQQIRWIGRRDLSQADLLAAPHLRPVLIRKGSLGHGAPERDMMVSPSHRMLVTDVRNALYFDTHEVLVAANQLLQKQGIHRVAVIGVSYIHFMCDQHQIVLSEGAWTESFQPGAFTLNGMDMAQRSEIFDLFPALKTQTGIATYATARRTLKRHEAQLIVN